MKTKQFLIVCFLFFAFHSCKTLDMTILNPEGAIGERLPKLKAVIDLSVVEQNDMFVSGMSFSDSNDEEAQMILQNFRKEKPFSTTANDYKLMYEREVKNNITHPVGDFRGSLFCKVTAINAEPQSVPLLFFSVFSFGLLNLAGMPLNISSASVDLEVQVLNNEDEVIGFYHATSKASVVSGLYFGYPLKTAIRVSKIEAFSKAMRKIKEQINAESELLQSQLR